ncbi:hypothetical protein K1W54_41620 [Micromonospora sp. CPCC 205371]|nr:hypothetical protein [Micromonospora sp. CPCC 205371]
MIGRSRVAAVVQALLLGVGAGACDLDSCADKVADAQAEMYRDHRWTEEDLPGIGQYVEVHWQTRALGNACSRAPGPTDWEYRGVVRMRTEEAQELLAAYEWTVASPVEVWPALRLLVPTDVEWLHSDSYTKALADQGRPADVYLSPDDALVYFALQS